MGLLRSPAGYFECDEHMLDTFIYVLIRGAAEWGAGEGMYGCVRVGEGVVLGRAGVTGEVSAYLQARWGPRQMPIRVKEERKIGGVGSALSRLGDQCVLQGVGGGSIYHVYLCFKLESFYCVDCRMACVRKRAHIYVCACVGMGLDGGGDLRSLLCG